MSSQQLRLPVASSSSSSTRPSIFSHSRRLRGGKSVLLSRNAAPNLSLNLPRHRRPPIPVVRAFGEEAEALITDSDGGNAAIATSVDEQEPEPTPEDLEYVGQIKRVLELLRKNRDMLFGEVKLTIMIEDPREVERRRLLGIDDSNAPSRDDLVEALEERYGGKYKSFRRKVPANLDKMKSTFHGKQAMGKMSFAPGMVASPTNQTQRLKGKAIDMDEYVGDSDKANEDESDADTKCLRVEESRSPPKTVHSSRKRKSEGGTSSDGKRQELLNWSARNEEVYQTLAILRMKEEAKQQPSLTKQVQSRHD